MVRNVLMWISRVRPDPSFLDGLISTCATNPVYGMPVIKKTTTMRAYTAVWQQPYILILKTGWLQDKQKASIHGHYQFKIY